MHLDLQLARLQVDQRGNRVEQGLGCHGFAGLVAAAHKVVHAVDDFARPPGLLGYTAQGHVHIVQGLWHGGGVFEQVERAIGITGDGGQRLVQLVAEQGGHLAHGGQSGRGLKALLAGPREFFDAPLFADVDYRAHPAGLLALHADERCLDDQHLKACAVSPHEDRLEAFTRRRIARQPDGLALLVLVHHFRGPIGHGRQLARQLFRGQSHHLAKGRVHVGDAPFQVARAQARHQRVFHGLAKGQRLGQVVFGFEAAARVLGQQNHHRDQRNRHGGDQCGQHVGEQVGLATAAVHAQDQGVARQVHQLLGREHAQAPALGARNGQPRAVGFGEGDFVAPAVAHAQAFADELLQPVGDHREAHQRAALGVGQAHVHDFHAQAIDLGQEIGTGITGPIAAACAQAGLLRIAQGFGAAHAFKHRTAQGRVGRSVQVQRGVAPLDAQHVAVFAQERLRLQAPKGF